MARKNGAEHMGEPCPMCGCKWGRKTHTLRVYYCENCGGVVGTCYLGESYSFVLPYFSKETVPANKTRYFDLTCLGSEGITRRHGWYCPETKLITQVG